MEGRIRQRANHPRLRAAPSPEGNTALWKPLRGYAHRMRTKPHQSRIMPKISIGEIRDRLRTFRGELHATRELTIEPSGDRIFHVHGYPESRRESAFEPSAPWPLRWFRWLKVGT